MLTIIFTAIAAVLTVAGAVAIESATYADARAEITLARARIEARF